MIQKYQFVFFNDCEGRAILGDENNKWWFNVVDYQEDQYHDAK